MSGFVRAGFSFLKNIGKGKTSPTISSVKPKVGKLKKIQKVRVQQQKEIFVTENLSHKKNLRK